MHGPFAAMFRGDGLPVPAYLCLLNLGHEQHALAALGRVREAMAAEDAAAWVEGLLAGPNWRPHLVAAVAYLADGDARLDREALWRRLEAGSWVAPQLTAAAFFSDAAFSARCRARLEAAGLPNAKTVASLLGAASLCEGLAPFAERAREVPAVAASLAADAAYDRSDGIVRHWATAMRALFETLAIPLVPLDPGLGPCLW
jgi:hypothetical protein